MTRQRDSCNRRREHVPDRAYQQSSDSSINVSCWTRDAIVKIIEGIERRLGLKQGKKTEQCEVPSSAWGAWSNKQRMLKYQDVSIDPVK